MNSYEESKKLYGIVERIVMKIVRNMDFVRSVPATVTGVSGSSITAYLAGDDIGLVSIYQNRTGQVINIGDIVYIIIPTTNSLTNAFIGWVKI